MSTIRRQSLISSAVVYTGFALGILNTYLFTREGGLTKEQLGVTTIFIAFANIMFAVASVGMPAYLTKFFPYYKSNLRDKENDQLTWSLLVTCTGFLVVLLMGLGLKNLVVDRIFNNSPQLLRYYYWTFPFGFGYTIYMVLEAYAWQQGESVFTNLLKEVVFRLMVTVLIVLTTLNIFDSFDSFVAVYAFTFLLIVIFLLYRLHRRGKLHFSFSVSRVSRKFFRRIRTLVLFVWSGNLIYHTANVFDTIIIAAVMPNGMAAAGIFAVAQNISNLMQAPQRAVISASIGPLSHAWRDKNFERLKNIYRRSSINQLIFSTAVFCLIWMNFEHGIRVFNIQGDYLAAKWVFFFLGLTRIIDMGSGLNSQIIGTSIFWRFEFVTGLILLCLILPLNWQLTRYMGVLGPAIANLISFTVYNYIRYRFLLRRFGMQPFTVKTLLTLLLAALCYLICYFLFNGMEGFAGILVRSLVFTGLFIPGMLAMKLTPDAVPVLQSVRRRLGF